MKKSNIIIWVLSIVLILSCNKTEWNKEVPLSLKIKSDINQPIEIKDYILTVKNIELTMTSIHIHGERLQAGDVDKVYNNNIYLNFSNPDSVNFKIDLPVGTYEKLEVSITFDTQTNSSYFSADIFEDGNQPFESYIDIPLIFEQIKNLPVKNQNNENIILIDEKSKFIEIVFNGQNSFNGINYGAWNSLMNTNQGQSEIDLNSVLGAKFVEIINNNFSSTLQLKILQ